jgi:hypothetical protein
MSDDILKKVKDLKSDIDRLNKVIIEKKVEVKNKEEQFLEVAKKIQELGFNPKTIKEDKAKLKKEIEDKIAVKEKEVTQVKEALEKIENKLNE